MHTQAPFQTNIIINPPINKQNNCSSGLTIIQHQHVSPQLEKSLNHQNNFPTYNYHGRPSSSSNPRPQLQQHILSSSHQPKIFLPPKYFRIESNKKIDVVFQQSKRQNFEPTGLSNSKQKEGDSKKQIAINSCPNSNSKKAVVQSLIFPASEQSNKQMKFIVQKKIDFYSKVAALPKTTIPNFEKMNQLCIPLNNVHDYATRQIKTDRNVIERKEHTLMPNMSIPHNLSFKNQQFEFDCKGNIENKQLESTSNSFQNIFIGQRHQRKKSFEVGCNPSIKKNMTQANFWPMLNSPSQQNQQNPLLFHNIQTTSKEQKQSDSKNQNGQYKKKSKFQFFKNIKMKRTSCATQVLHKQFQLSDFNLMDKLGKGAFGDVYIAQQKISRFICVLKKLSKKKLKENKLQEQLFRQIKIQSYLHHRHLTSLYSFFCDQEYIYIILQLLPDGSMMQAKKKRRIPQNQVSSYMRQISLGLKYMHTQNVIHRDIKPQNIFLYDGYAKIGDFGCSIYTSTNRSTQIGSLAYLSPQQLKQQAYNQKIDVWSLGVMTYQMLTGASPFEKDIIKIAKKQMAPQLSELTFTDKFILSQQAKDFLIGMLNRDPQKRFGIQQVLKHQFILKYIKQDQSKLQKLLC